MLSGSTLNLGKGMLVCGSMVNCHGWTVSLEVASMWWCGVGGSVTAKCDLRWWHCGW